MLVEEYHRKVAPLVNPNAWQAFLALIEYEEQNCIKKLVGEKPAESLIRINAEYNLLQKLKKVRDTYLSHEKVMS